jgi:Family of unknown function (DUF6069)
MTNPEYPTTDTSTGPAAATTPQRRRRIRATAVAAAVLTALVGWALVGPVLGRDLTVTVNGGPPQTVGAAAVLAVSLLASLLAVGSLVLLERITERARTIWTTVAVLALLVSLGGPLSAQAPISTKLSLALLHVIVAAVLIPPLTRTSPSR